MERRKRHEKEEKRMLFGYGFNPYGPVSQYCAHQASCQCGVYVPKAGYDFVQIGNKKYNNT